MHTVADEEFPFYRTIDLQMVSETKSYTTAGEPLFYLYPLRFDNRRYYNGTNQSVGRLENVADAEDICRNIGDGWRLPTASELLLSFVYENALGGNAINSNYHDGQNIYGWYQNWTGNYWSSSYYEAKGSTTRFGMEMSAGYPDSAPVSNNNYFRCVRDNTNSGKKYPYLIVESSGVTIVSRDASGGTDPSVLFASGETPDTSVAMNKVAPKFQIENSSSNGKTWAEAKAACESKGSGWRLPTQREMYLVLSMGGTVTNIENQGFGDSTTWTGNGFEKISTVHWTLTSRDSNYWLVGHNNGEFGAWATVESTTWAWYRCVRTIE